MQNEHQRNHLTIVTDQLGPRLDYIVQYIVKTLCGFDYQIVHDIHQIPAGPYIYYCLQPPDSDNIHILPVGLLIEKGIHPQVIDIGRWNDLPTLFPTGGAMIPFDIFSASFYLISRYEEYLEHSKDKFGRYSHQQSIAFKNDFLHLPLINLWAKAMQTHLTNAFPELICTKRVARCIPTYDIDITWKYKHRGLKRTVGGFVKSIVKGRFVEAFQRIKVLFGFEKDPYEVYQWLDALHLKYQLKPVYFFLLANKIKDKDKNIHPSKKGYQQLIASQSLKNNVGIHPSWQSGDSLHILQEEVTTMVKITGKPVYKSRFHFLRFILPDGYLKLIALGIIEDYSMGYGSINGFRASVSTPFYWYNLVDDSISTLIVYPFCWMDATSYYQLKHSPEEAFAELFQFKSIVQQCDGDLIILSHNNFFSEEAGIEGWRGKYKEGIRN
jgi:hypothetical protein